MTTIASEIDQHFPFSGYRDGQREAIEFAAQAYRSGKQIVIIEAPTGSGKTAIGYTLMGIFGRSYYLTVTKVLQDQILDEFGDRITELRGRASYPCTYWDRYGQKLVRNRFLTQPELDAIIQDRPDCGTGYCRTRCVSSEQLTPYKCTRCFLRDEGIPAGKKNGVLRVLPPGMDYSACPYYEQVERAIAADKLVMNFSAFLFQTQLTTRFHEPRELLVADEAHAVESILLDFVSLTLDDRQLQREGVELPVLEHASEYAQWAEQLQLQLVIGSMIKNTKRELDEASEPRDRQELTRQLEELTRLYHKYIEFQRDVYAGGEWVSELETVIQPGRTYRKLVLKPVTARGFLRPLILNRAKRVLLMSATILDINVMCEALGISRDQVATYRMRNRFPLENRPILVEPCGKLTGGQAGMERWGPQLVAKVDELAERHPERGIIHTHNFAIAELLLEQCAPEVRARLAYQRRFHDKAELLEYHADTPGSIIIAPAMHEGVSLLGELSRWQVIAKVPYPNFKENRQLERRMEIDERYYPWLVALAMVQAYGRSIRSESDWATTYIVDEAFRDFYRFNRRLFPGWFQEALQWP